MGRELKRVPLDFNWPIGCGWDGYCPDIETFQTLFGEKYKFLYLYTDCGEICDKCETNAGECSEDADYCFWHNPINKTKWYNDVPKGEGYQLWETTTEGSPESPVFETLEELCEWCEENATTFASYTASKEEWMKMLDDDNVCHQEGNFIFI